MYEDLRSKPLQYIDKMFIDGSASSMFALEKEIYIGCSGGLHIYNQGLKKCREIRFDKSMQVNGISSLPDKTLIVAAGSGLFHIDNQGIWSA